MGLLSRLLRPTPPPAATESRALNPYGLPLGVRELFAPIGMLGTDQFDAEAFSAEVDPETALTATGVYACVQVIASAIATLPVHVRDRKSNAAVDDHPVARLIRRPNDYMAWNDLVESWMLNTLTTGNGPLWAERDRFFDPVGLYPLPWLNCRPIRRGRGLAYAVRLGDKTTTLPGDQVVHVRNMAPDGVNGISPLKCGSRAVSLALALDEFAARFFTNGASIGGVIELGIQTSPEALQEFKRLWAEQYEGLRNAHKIAAAPGMKFHPKTNSPRDSQADEQRRTQLREIARIYQVPPHKIGDLERATFSNIEDQSRDFAEGTLRRWVVKCEQALEYTLLREDERDQYQIRFNLDATVRGSLKDRVEAMAKATGGAPIFTQNEARDHFKLAPIRGGNVLLQNLNQTPAAASRRADAMLAQVAANFATKEANAIKRAARKHAEQRDELLAWSEDFYARHELQLRQAFDGAGIPGPALAAYCEQRRVQLRGAGDPAEHAAHIREDSGRTLAQLIDQANQDTALDLDPTEATDA
ncbi:MAG: phage portal protein [Planctomycetota bacterium]